MEESIAFITITGKCLLENFVSCSYFFMAITLFRCRVFTALRYLQNKRSRIPSWKLRAIRSGFYELHRMQSRVSCREARPPSPCRSIQTTISVEMWTEKYLWRHRRPMYAFQKSCLPMPAQRYDSAIWPTSFCNKSNHKWYLGLHQWRLWTPYNPVESRSPESWGFTALRKCYIRTWSPPRQVLWFSRWDYQTYFKTW